jgi:hypothetical protein
MPGVISADLTGLIVLRGCMDENALFRQLQVWARQRFGAGQAP